MASIKISDLTSVSTLDNSDVLPIVNNDETKKVSIQQLTNKITSAIPQTGFTPVVVQTLPTQDIDTHTIYLVPKQDSETGDVYDEYLYINNAWEHVGSTSVDLSNYYTKNDLYNLIPMQVLDFEGNDFQNFITVNSTTMKNRCSEIMTFFASKSATYGLIALKNIGSGSRILYLTNINRGLNARTTAQYQFATIDLLSKIRSDNDYKTKFTLGKGISLQGTWNGDVYTCTGITKIGAEYNMDDYLSKYNTTAYTPTTDYHPATKKYVDDAISSAITDALGGSY